MKKLNFHKQKIFRQTEDVTFYDISVPGSNASDLVVHETAATSPPNDEFGNKIFGFLILLYIFFIFSISFVFSFNRTSTGFKNK